MRIPSEPAGLLSGEDDDARLLRRMEQEADASSGAGARRRGTEWELGQ